MRRHNLTFAPAETPRRAGTLSPAQHGPGRATQEVDGRGMTHRVGTSTRARSPWLVTSFRSSWPAFTSSGRHGSSGTKAAPTAIPCARRPPRPARPPPRRWPHAAFDRRSGRRSPPGAADLSARSSAGQADPRRGSPSPSRSRPRKTAAGPTPPPPLATTGHAQTSAPGRRSAGRRRRWPPDVAQWRKDPFWSQPELTKSWDLDHFTVQDEKQLGEQLNSLILQLNPEDPGPGLRRVTEAAQPLLKLVDPKEREYQFFVLNSEVANAFSHPGGYVYVSRKLLDMIPEDEDRPCSSSSSRTRSPTSSFTMPWPA